MEVISGMFKSIYETIGVQTYKPSEDYIDLPFIVRKEVNDGILMYNTMTHEIVITTDNENSMDEEYLVEHWFKIPSFLNSESLSYIVKNARRSKYGNKVRKINTYTIFTTTECNARCYYCYESGCVKRKMSAKTALDVAKYIEKNNPDGIVNLKWFGGEPLYNSNVIDIICKYLKEKDIFYESCMTSNGYLMHEHDIQKVKSVWNLHRIQITLDGTQEIYNKTKNYIYDGNPFSVVMNNIESLLKSGINVDIRLNLSQSNCVDLKNLICVFSERFSEVKNINVYAYPLFEGICDGSPILNEEQRSIVYSSYIEIQKLIKNKHLGMRIASIPKFKIHHCMADNGKSIVILPEGEISLCEHHCDDEYIGSIYNDTKNEALIKSWSESSDKLDSCVSCIFNPDCVRLKKCPSETQCNSAIRTFRFFQTTTMMMSIYDRWKRGEYGNKNT